MQVFEVIALLLVGAGLAASARTGVAPLASRSVRLR
jgi:hypothetical protein